MHTDECRYSALGYVAVTFWTGATASTPDHNGGARPANKGLRWLGFS
jgi:hypothetical protein